MKFMLLYNINEVFYYKIQEGHLGHLVERFTFFAPKVKVNFRFIWGNMVILFFVRGVILYFPKIVCNEIISYSYDQRRIRRI